MLKPYIDKHGKTLRGAMKGERKARLFTTGYEATIPCKRCGNAFDSTDRRKVKHCDTCRMEITRIADTFGIGGEMHA